MATCPMLIKPRDQISPSRCSSSYIKSENTPTPIANIIHQPQNSKITMPEEIWVLPLFAQGHLFPSIELCKRIASRNFRATLVIPSFLSSSIPSSLRDYPLVNIAEFPSPQIRPPSEPDSTPPHEFHNQQIQEIEKLLSARSDNPNATRPVCAIIDDLAFWFYDVFDKFQVPTVTFFTSGACSAALEYAYWKAHPQDMTPGETRFLPGLPQDMALTYSDLKRRPSSHFGPPPAHAGDGPPVPFSTGESGHGGGGPSKRKMEIPKPGEQPLWLEDSRKTKALMINTCDDLERPFVDYLANEIGKPVFSVGPLLPDHCWKPAGSLVHDGTVRANRQSSVSEDEVIQWLDSKPRGSVLYVAFGSLDCPTMEECAEIADALEASDRPFIWVIQPGSGKPAFLRFNPNTTDVEGEYYPHGLDSRVGKRGLIIKGWAPQLLILSHPSTGGFLSHCGWNSTVEAVTRGIPLLAWPMKGDQYFDAKLVVNHLKLGYNICDDDLSRTIKKEDIVKGIERLMNNKEMKERAESLSLKFQSGFPKSSLAALDDFLRDFTQVQS